VHRVTSKAKAGTRAYFTAKDLEMARRSDYGLMVWDCKSTGTLSNVIELLKRRKQVAVFVNRKTEFVTISDRAGLDHLLALMSDQARIKAEKRIRLSSVVARLELEHPGQEQRALAPLAEAKMSAADASTAGEQERATPTAPAATVPSGATPGNISVAEGRPLRK